MAIKKSNANKETFPSSSVVFRSGIASDCVDALAINDRVAALQGALYQAASKLIRGCLVSGFNAQGVVALDDSTSNRKPVYRFRFEIELTPYSSAALKQIEALVPNSLRESAPDNVE